MGYKEQFIDYKSISYDEVQQLESLRLSKLKDENPERYNLEIKKNSKISKSKNSLKYEKGMTRRIKTLIAIELQDRKTPFVEYQNSGSIINKISFKNVQLTHFQEAVEMLLKVSLNIFLGVEVQPGKNFLCEIIPGNIASINVGKNGTWRYFTRNGENTKGYELGIIDITEIIYNLNYPQAIAKLCEMTMIDVEEGKWLKAQQRSYSENIKCIHSFGDEMGVKYQNLFKYVKRHLYILEELNKHGLSNITSQEKSVNGNDVFFISTRHLGKRLAVRGIKKSYTNINKLLNMFTALGLIAKVPLTQVPSRLQEEAKKLVKMKSSEVVKDYTNNKKHCHPISFYQIPYMSMEILSEAEKRVIRLKQEGITATGFIILSDKVKKALGLSLYNNLFNDKISFVRGIEKAKTKQREEAKKRMGKKQYENQTSII